MARHTYRLDAVCQQILLFSPLLCLFYLCCFYNIPKLYLCNNVFRFILAGHLFLICIEVIFISNYKSARFTPKSLVEIELRQTISHLHLHC